MEQKYTEPKGQFDVMAVVDHSFNYAFCLYKIYKDNKLIAQANSYTDMAKFMHLKHGFDLDEIGLAVTELNEREHDIAHFGTFGTFLFTSDSLETHSNGTV